MRSRDDPPGAHRVRYILDLAVPEILVLDGETIGGSTRRLRDTDAAGLRQGLQPSGDVHAGTVDVAPGFDHLADVYSDAKRHARLWRLTVVAQSELALHEQRT